MHGKQPLAGVVLLFVVCLAHSGNGQRITTIQLDGVQYFVSRMNPYSPELNYFLAYQYCRSLGLQLASFETREKADSITQYLSNAGYNKYDFWTSGNRLGTDMYLWMSTGLPFNATFNYMRKQNESDDPLTADVPTGSTSPQRTARESDSGSTSGCVALKSGSPAFEWDTDDCMKIKDFICEQTRCYYYNYGSIPVSSAQGRPAFTTTTTQRPAFTSSQQQPQQQIGSQRAGGGGGGSGGLGGILGFDFLTGMRTSSTSSSGVIGYNDLLNEARSTSSSSTPPPPSPPAQPAAAPAADVVLPHDSADAEAEQATNGPYDSFHGVLEMLDDPAAYVDHQRARAATADEEYVSTIEPETVTIYERSLKTVH